MNGLEVSMTISDRRFTKQCAFGLAILLAMPFTQAVAESPQKTPIEQQTQSTPSVQNNSQASDGQGAKADASKTQDSSATPDNPVPVQLQSANQSEQPASSQSGLDLQQSNEPKPVGSAAAPYERTTGVAASRPAGAVIAPAKQRRARSILIRVGVVVGAAVAVGTVVVLSHGSSSRPN
jgi:hypothetical protein